MSKTISYSTQTKIEFKVQQSASQPKRIMVAGFDSKFFFLTAKDARQIAAALVSMANTLEKDLDIREEAKGAVVCSKCGGEDVHIACWVNLSTLEILENFGSWGETDTKWCVSCQEHVSLTEKKATK